MGKYSTFEVYGTWIVGGGAVLKKHILIFSSEKALQDRYYYAWGPRAITGEVFSTAVWSSIPAKSVVTYTGADNHFVRKIKNENKLLAKQMSMYYTSSSEVIKNLPHIQI